MNSDEAHKTKVCLAEVCTKKNTRRLSPSRSNSVRLVRSNKTKKRISSAHYRFHEEEKSRGRGERDAVTPTSHDADPFFEQQTHHVFIVASTRASE